MKFKIKAKCPDNKCRARLWRDTDMPMPHCPRGHGNPQIGPTHTPKGTISTRPKGAK